MKNRLNEIADFWFALMLASACGLIYGSLYQDGGSHRGLVLCFAVFGWAGGRLALAEGKHEQAIGVAALAACALCTATFTPMGGFRTLSVGAAAIFAICFFRVAYKAGTQFPALVTVVSMLAQLLLLALCQFLQFTNIMLTASVLAVLTVAPGLLALSWYSADRCVFMSSAGPQKGVGSRAVKMAAIYLGACALLASFSASFAAARAALAASSRALGGLYGLVMWLWGVICYVFNLFWAWLMKFMRPYQDTDLTGGAAPSGGGSGKYSGLFALITIILAVFLAVLLILAGVAILRATLKVRKRAPGAEVASDDYTETREKVKLRPEKKRRAKRGFWQPRQSINDFDDNRMKVRFAFQQMLKAKVSGDPLILTKTPNEMAGEAGRSAFYGYYNEARYTDRPIPEEAVDLAKKAIKDGL